MNPLIGLSKAAIWLPEGYEDAAYISAASGIPSEVVAHKMGIVRKCRARLDEHPSTMAIHAARQILEEVDPKSIDLIIWTGSEYKDYNVWSAGIFVQEQLGCSNAWAFDLAARCSSNVVGLHVAKSMMQANPSLKRVLLCGGHRTGDLVNYQDPKSRFLYSLSDGGAALLLERGGPNPILEASIITDGAFSLDVIIPGGGTRERTRDGVPQDHTYLTVPDVEGMRDRLADRSIQNFTRVIREAQTRSNIKAIDYLALLHMKRSAFDAVVAEVGLQPDQAIYMDHYGHFGAPDQVLSLGLAEKQSKLRTGDHVVLASAGIGYTWSALALRWESPAFLNGHLLELFTEKETA